MLMGILYEGLKLRNMSPLFLFACKLVSISVALCELWIKLNEIMWFIVNMKRCIHVNSVNVAYSVRYVLQCLCSYHVGVSIIVYSTWRVLLKTIYLCIYIYMYGHTYIHMYMIMYVYM